MIQLKHTLDGGDVKRRGNDRRQIGRGPTPNEVTGGRGDGGAKLKTRFFYFQHHQGERAGVTVTAGVASETSRPRNTSDGRLYTGSDGRITASSTVWCGFSPLGTDPPVKLQSRLRCFDLIRRSRVKDGGGGSNNGQNQILAGPADDHTLVSAFVKCVKQPLDCFLRLALLNCEVITVLVGAK